MRWASRSVHLIVPFASKIMTIGAHNQWLMVVDDEPALVNLLKLSLERAGYQVAICNDAETGLEIFLKSPDRFAALIVDWSLGGMSGEEMITAARKSRPRLPAILTSGYPHKTSLENTHFLQKPFTPAALSELLQQVLKS